jgi:hypothetical protein
MADEENYRGTLSPPWSSEKTIAKRIPLRKVVKGRR